MLQAFKATYHDMYNALAKYDSAIRLAFVKSKAVDVTEQDLVILTATLDKVQENLGDMMNAVHDIVMYHSVRHIPCEEFDRLQEWIIRLFFTNSDLMEYGEIDTQRILQG